MKFRIDYFVQGIRSFAARSASVFVFVAVGTVALILASAQGLAAGDGRGIAQNCAQMVESLFQEWFEAEPDTIAADDLMPEMNNLSFECLYLPTQECRMLPDSSECFAVLEEYYLTEVAGILARTPETLLYDGSGLANRLAISRYERERGRVADPWDGRTCPPEIALHLGVDACPVLRAAFSYFHASRVERHYSRIQAQR